MNRREFLARSCGALAGMGAIPDVARALPASSALYGEVADALLDRRGLPEDVRRYTRYLTLYGMPLDYDMEAAAAGLSFWVNSLSTQAYITPPRQVTKTLYALDIRDYGWSEDQWRAVTLFDGYYNTPNSMILRGDFFCHITSIATRTTLYYDLLYGVGKAPKNAAEFRKIWRVSLKDARALHKERGVPILPGKSGVARYSRLIQYAPTTGRVYWETFDSRTAAGFQNIANNLLGTYRHDAGEIILNLPNDLQTYLLINQKGDRVEVADSEIIKVEFLYTARRCVECHKGQGIITPKEFIPEWVQRAVDLESYDKDTMKWFEEFYYSDPNGIVIRHAKERYQEAVVKCWPTAQGETVEDTCTNIVNGFLGICSTYAMPVTLAQAAHELGYTEGQIQLCLQNLKTSNINLPALGGGDTYPRDDWELNSFRQFYEILKKGEY